MRLARLVASGVGAEAGFSVDDTEDLRIAVSELVALLVDDLDDSARSIVVTYQGAPGEVTVEGRGDAAPTSSRAAALDDLALEILRVVVDDHTFEADKTGRRFRLVKRTRGA